MDFHQFVQISFCHCGIHVDLKTSWSNQNPGRRFLGCKSYEFSSACRFFNWYDPPLIDHSRVVLFGLLKKLRYVEKQRKNERVLWIVLSTLALIK